MTDFKIEAEMKLAQFGQRVDSLRAQRPAAPPTQQRVTTTERTFLQHEGRPLWANSGGIGNGGDNGGGGGGGGPGGGSRTAAGPSALVIRPSRTKVLR